MPVLMSAESPQSDNSSLKVKKQKRKKEHIRPGALLPDDIRLNNHMVCSRMSSEEYNSCCKYLSKKCKDAVECNAHTSKNNLEKISSNLKAILAQSGEISKDWDSKKILHSGNYGYLNLAVNQPEILKEINLIRKLVKSFNKGRAKIWKYKDLILKYHKSKPDFINLKHEVSNESPNTNDTAIRLAEKCSPYDKEEFKVISIRAN